MNRKGLIVYLSVLAVLIIATAVSVFFLYSGRFRSGNKKSDRNSIVAVSNYRILPAVPSDAAAVFYSDRLEDGLSLLCDTTNILSDYFGYSSDGNISGFLSYLSSSVSGRKSGILKDASFLVSLHYNGDLVPLIIIGYDCSASDSSERESVIAAADSADLHCSVFSCSGTAYSGSSLDGLELVIASPSETIVNSAERHIAEGHSILDDERFSEIAADAEGRTLMFFSLDNSDKLLSRIVKGKYLRYSDFFKKLADWGFLRLTDNSGNLFSMTGLAESSDDPSYFFNVFKSVSGSIPRVMEILPSSTVFAVSLPLNSLESYLNAFGRYLDASGLKEKYGNKASTLKLKTGTAPADFMKDKNVKEISMATFLAGNQLKSVILLRTGTQKKDFPLTENKFAGFASAVFGNFFSLKDESSCAGKNGYIVIGARDDVKSFLSLSASGPSLGECLDHSGLSSSLNDMDGCVFFSYFSISGFASRFDDVATDVVAGSLRRTLTGISYSPAVMFVRKEESDLKLYLDVSRDEPADSPVSPLMAEDTTVVVPKGPFKVMNSGTGKECLFEQRPNMYLVLKELSGKSMWGVPFSKPICGAVEGIDYYANGKIQYLFCAGSRLYLIDRLGRFVSHFPVDLGKDVLLGPAVYDFTGAKGYNVMVLHKDNTICMYDIHGKIPSGWKGMTSKKTIKELPELIKVNKKNYWVVRTSESTLIFGFYGGDALTDTKGNKMISPDSKIEVGESYLNVTCRDGKQRKIKLN
ncbi:MAG: hypothetical protein LKI42_01245 [Bacteroidales bacterium]|jgi:hypothetical protein|nr:hypothetical protein [Bacteroidales bacterium]MCI1785211.1 hypothetical protein [Bacteroidales bacterium]